jgi:hypothetical protein
MIYCFFLIRFTVNMVEEYADNLPVSHTFIGLTIACWGGNISG